MARKDKKNSKQSQPNKTESKVNVFLPANISTEEMQHILARAIVEAEAIKEQQKQAKKEEALKQWKSSIGYKEYDNKCKLWRSVKTFFNRIKCILNVCFIRREKIQSDRASFALIQTILKLFFDLANWILAIATTASVIFGIYKLCTTALLSPNWIFSICCIIVAIPLFILSRLFHMVSIEVEKIEDRNYLFGLFASIASIVSIIIAVVAIIKGSLI